MSNFLLPTLLIGVGATALLDAWILALNRIFKLPMTNWALAGRWFHRAASGRVFHQDISKEQPFPHELALGWACHYAIGVIYAGIWMLAMPSWRSAPTFLPTWIFGLLTILPGWFLLQPGMGLGIAASKRPNAMQIRCLNIMSHSVFAVGLYAMALWVRPYS